MFAKLPDQKTAHEMERMLGEYEYQLRKLRFYLAKYNLGALRAEKRTGCVNRADLRRVMELSLPDDVRHLVLWCWMMDAACGKLQDWEDRENCPGRYSGFLKAYYGLSLPYQEQKQWMVKSTRLRRQHTMQSRHMEQTTFYETRGQILCALFTAGVQIGLYRPFADEEDAPDCAQG